MSFEEYARLKKQEMDAALAAGVGGVFPIDGECPCKTNWTTGDYHNNDCSEAKKLRDSWCTPESLTKLLPTVDLDPASNERSTVKAIRSLWLERGEDGLEARWDGTIFLNGPYSDMLPWARKARREWEESFLEEAIFLVKLDPTTEWWKVLTGTPPKENITLWTFNKRLQHVPPPRIKSSTNNFASALIHWRAFAGKWSDLTLDSIATRWHLPS